jgi:peptide/nickel transport system substrate-binding protein
MGGNRIRQEVYRKMRMKHYSFRKLGILILAVSLLAFGAGCDTAPDITSSTPFTTPVITPDGPVTLTVGSTKAFKNTNRFADYWYGVLSNLTTHDSLFKLNSEMELVPWLATGWQISDDSTEFTFTITDQASFHDGVPLTVEDVKFSVEYYRDNVPGAAWMKEIIDTVTTDGNDVTLKLTRPYGNLMSEFMTYSIIPRHIWEGVDNPAEYNGDDMAVGSGPFKLVSWDEAAGLFVFEANDDYFLGAPTVDRLEVSVFRNMDTLVMSLIRGDIDTWWDYSGEFPFTYVPPLLKAGNIEFASATFLGIPAAVGFNMDKYPASELDFRRAVSYGVNYGEIADYVFSGYGTEPSGGFVPGSHTNYNTDIPRMEYNPDKAVELLDAMGIKDTDGDGYRERPDGEKIVLKLLTRNSIASLVRATEMTVANLRDIGLDSEVRALDTSTWVAAKDEGDYDLIFFRATPWGTLMHASHASGYFDSRRTGSGVLHNFSDADYLALCDQRLATADPARQRELDLMIQQYHYDYLPGIPLVWIDSVYPYREGWDNWVIDHIYGGVVNSFSWSQVQAPSE